MKMNLDSINAKPNESLSEHTNKVLKVANIILERIPRIIDNFSSKIGEPFFLKQINKCGELKDFILEIVRFHDYGKVNPHFQEHLKRNNKTKSSRKHAIYSFFIWLFMNAEKMEKRSLQTFEIRSVIAYATIVGHHNSLKEIKETINDENTKDAYEYVEHLFNWGIINKTEVDYLEEKVDILLNLRPNGVNDIALTFSKFIYSILITSDSIASSDILEAEYEIAVDRLLFKHINQTDIHENISNSGIVKSVKQSDLQVEKPFSCARNLNDVRILLNKKSVASWDNNADIYILEAPVGTGKTISSLSLADTIVRNEEKRKIISVFPLNSVQTQYQHTIQEEIKVKDEYLNVINSESLFKIHADMPEKDDEDKENFTISSSNLWLFERSCFSNEFIITSHVRFFDTFTAISRKSSLGFLSLIDSVVIIDEFQNYPPTYWEGIWGDLLRLSELFGVKWIFTTGTFPVSMNQLTNTFKDRIKFVLSNEENQNLFSNFYVKDRCEIIKLNTNPYDSLELLGEDIAEDILQREKMDNYSQFIVCVSYVQHAKKLCHRIKEKLHLYGYECFFLCGRHSSSYKKKLMNVIKDYNCLENRKHKIVLITTKTVECGMDFDFDFGYKEFDMFDSVEQLSGRVNRSHYRKAGGVKVFTLSRKKQEKEKLYVYNDDVLSDLQNKKFRSLYEKMYNGNKINIRKKKEEIDNYHTHFKFKNYKDYMIIIDNVNYCTDVYFVKSFDEETFKTEITSLKRNIDYAEKVIQSISLKKKLEPYQITVTNRWLKQQVDVNLKCEEIGGIQYFILCDEDKFESLFEIYEVDGIKSYLEKDVSQEETYEFY